MFLQMVVVEEFEKIARAHLSSGRDCFGRLQIRNWFVGVEWGALENWRKKGGVPMVWAYLGDAARIGDSDECGQVLIFRTESVADPGAHARESIQDVTGAHLILSG